MIDGSRNTYPRETREFQPVTVTIDGEPVVDGVEFAVTEEQARPTTWNAATSLSGKIGVMVEGLARGTYTVWARVTEVAEQPVIMCGKFVVE